MLEIKGLKKAFGSLEVLKGVDLKVNQGDVVAILGPSGSGKTTMLRCVNFLEHADGGSLIFDGKEYPFHNISKKDIAAIRQKTAFVFQNYNLFLNKTALHNVTEGLIIGRKMPKTRAEEKARAALEKVGMLDRADYYPHQLSGGQQQRVALARALVMRPGLLLLDEPLSNLDAKLRESMRFEISSIQKELGITVIYVTHDQSEAMTMSDRVVVMSRGVIQQIGTPYEIYRNPANKMVADFIGLVNFVEGEVQGDRVYISGTGVSFPNTSGITGSATIAVRPENITMSRTSGTIEGTLVHRFYLGDAVDYRVQCKHHVIRVIVKGAELKEFTDGEKVYLDFDKIMVFDRD